MSITDLADGLMDGGLWMGVPVQHFSATALESGGVVDLLCALLFADGTVVVSGSLGNLARAVQIFEMWAAE